MLDIHRIRDNQDWAIAGLKKRGWNNAKEVVAQLLDLDAQRRQTQKETNDAQAEMNASARQIGALMKEGKKQEAEEAKKKSAELKKR